MVNDFLIDEIENRIIRERDGRYSINAYLFIIQALDFLLEKIIKQTKVQRHVTGQELSNAVRDFAIERFGPTAMMVLSHWGIGSTADIGNIVYNLISIGKMGKTKEDRIEDFHDVYDFENEFVKNFRFSADGMLN